MKRFALIGLALAALVAGLTGCEWNTGEDATSWSSAYDWVSFSGVYRGIGGGLLVTDYTTTPSIPGVTNVYSRTESGGTMAVRGTMASGRVSQRPVIPGSFMVSVGNNATLSDPGKAGILTGNGTGTVNYEGGTWSITIDPALADWDQANPIVVSYSYRVSSDGSSSSGAQSGATRISIYSFNVDHQGQNLTIVDNNGSTFSGKISKIRSLSGAQNTDIPQVADDETAHRAKATYYESELPADGDVIVASFEASGVSAANVPVRIVGTFEGAVSAGVFTSRQMDGTWIESGGKTGNINAQTESVAIQVPSTDAGTDTNTAAMAVSP